MATLQKVNQDTADRLLAAILARDGWELEPARGTAQKDGRTLHFFMAGKDAARTKAALAAMARQDAGKFASLGVLVVADAADLRAVREDRYADRYPRAFFTSLEELQAVADGTPIIRAAKPGNISAFPAEVVANRAIGGADSSHFVLTFRAPEMQEVWPSQFVMMDCAPEKFLLTPRRVQRGRELDELLHLPPFPLLKRPFGIQRAYYRHFDRFYQKQLALPPSLALALHTVYPHQFDMLYKVLPGGGGTPLLARLQPGDKVDMLGPLGSPYDVRVLRREGVAEVHVIGGGVGVAPLILLVQALRYYSFPIKVFIGISSLELLRYTGHVDSSFAGGPGDAYVYVDDLLDAGLTPADIFLSSDTPLPKRELRGIPPANLFHGLVPEQYRQFLQRTGGKAAPSTVAFTCGPDRMMEAVQAVTEPAGIALKCLLEKRMGCGYGVCLSCVCKVRDEEGGETYARVCTEGPVFDASEIIWNHNQTNSKSASATCGCVRPS